MTDQNEVLEVAKLGVEAEAFLTSQLGKKLFSRAEQEIMQEVEKLVAADPEDAILGRAIRSRIAVAESVMKWIIEIVNDGRAAHQELKQMDDLG